MDEWTFSRTTKINYSWSIKDKNKEIQNTQFVGNMYMILVILLNGWWMWLITNHTINSSIFIDFIKIIKHWIYFNEFFWYSELTLVIDNCSSYKSKATMSELQKLNMNIYFLPTYSPCLAPIEIWFAYLKHEFVNSWKFRKLNLARKESQNHIFTIMKLLTQRKVKKYFARFYEEIKLLLNSYK